MPNVVEAVLRSKYEDGVASGVENTRALIENTVSSMKDASAAAGAGIEAAFTSAVGTLEGWRTNLSKAADESDSGFKKMGLGAAAFGIATAEVFLRAAKAAADFVIEIMKEASEVAEARINFEALTAAQGQNADMMLGKLKAATEGQVNQLTLLRNANKVLTADLPLSAEQYDKLTESVFRLAKSAGTDAVAAQDALTTALLRGMSRGLGPAIGLHLQVKDAVTAMAAEMSTSAAAIPDHAKLQAFYNDLIEKTDAAVSKLPPKFLTLEEVLTQAHNAWHDLLDDFGTAITRSGVMQELFQRVSEAMEGENNTMDKQRNTALAVNDALIEMLRILATLLSSLSYVAAACELFSAGIQGLFFILVDFFVTAGLTIVTAVGQIVQVLSYLPGAAGKAFQPVLDKLAQTRDALQNYSDGAKEALTHSFDGVGSSQAKLDGLSASTTKLANDMEALRGTVLNGADGVTKHATAAQAAAVDQKALNEQLQKYGEMMAALSEASANTPQEKAMAQLVRQIAEIQKLDKLTEEQRDNLRAAAWAKYDAEIAKQFEEEKKRQVEQHDQQLAAQKRYQDQVLVLDNELSLASARDEEKAATKRLQDIERVRNLVSLSSEEGKRLLLLIEKNFDAEMDKIYAEKQRKKLEAEKKEIDDALTAANAIKTTMEGVFKGTLPESSALAALKNLSPVLDTLKQKLAQLNAQPVVTDAQIAQIQKLKAAIDQLNKLNLSPLKKAFDDMKQHVQQSTSAALVSFGQMLGGMLQGQAITGAKILQAAGQMLGGLISQMGTLLIQTGVAAIAATATGIPGPWSYTGGLEAIAEGIALTALGSALGGAGSAAGGGSAAAPSGGSSSQTNQNPQIINVGTPNGAAQHAQNQQTQHLITLNLKSNDSHIVSVVKNDIQTNGVLRVAVKQNG